MSRLLLWFGVGIVTLGDLLLLSLNRIFKNEIGIVNSWYRTTSEHVNNGDPIRDRHYKLLNRIQAK